jgi:hypothetical protein
MPKTKPFAFFIIPSKEQNLQQILVAQVEAIFQSLANAEQIKSQFGNILNFMKGDIQTRGISLNILAI